MRALALLLLGLAAPACAQLVNPPSVNTSQFATKSDISSVQAAIPPVCSTAPAKDSLNGSAGSAAPCTPPADNTRPTAVQAINTTLAGDCTWGVTFARATASSTPIVHATLKLAAGATQPVPCSPIAISSTGASGKCFPGQTTTLNLSIITAGLSLAPFGSTCTAGMTVMVNVREPTQ